MAKKIKKTPRRVKCAMSGHLIEFSKEVIAKTLEDGDLIGMRVMSVGDGKPQTVCNLFVSHKSIRQALEQINPWPGELEDWPKPTK